MPGSETTNLAPASAGAVSGKDAEQTARRAAGEAAAALVQSDMVVGLGTGDTAAYAIRAIAARHEGCKNETGRSVDSTAAPLRGLRCVATSRRSAELAAYLGLKLLELDDLDPSAAGAVAGAAAGQSKDAAAAHGRRPIDITIDGADEIDPQLQLIKGAGGALLFEKLVAQSSKRLVIIADPSKCVNQIGEKRLLPVEIVTLGSRHTRERILGVPGVLAATLRRNGEAPYRTDDGNLILDVQLDFKAGIRAPELHAQLKSLCGVIETGLFCSEADHALIGQPDGTVVRLQVSTVAR